MSRTYQQSQSARHLQAILLRYHVSGALATAYKSRQITTRTPQLLVKVKIYWVGVASATLKEVLQIISKIVCWHPV